MASNNDLYGVINAYDSIPSILPPIRIDTNGASPSIEFAPTGTLDSNNAMRIVSDIKDGIHTLHIYKGSTMLLSIQDTATNGSSLFLRSSGIPLPNPTSIMMSDSLGNIGGIASLPINRGGTGLTSIPIGGSILSSNGVGYTGITAGTGITINNSTISTSPSGVFTDMNLNGSILPGGESTIITIVGDVSIYPIRYSAITTGSQTVGVIHISPYSVITMRVTASRKSISSGSSMQLYSIVRSASNTQIKAFSNNASTGDKASVVPSISGDSLILTVYLTSGDIWKGAVEFVSII